MLKDPRFRNNTFNPESLRAYLSAYTAKLHECLGTIAQKDIDAASQMLRDVRARAGRIFVAGNGGSAAISEHLSCDFEKGTHLPGQSALQVQCLTSNTALLTAIANDFSYDDVFAYQLELAGVSAKDLLLLISSSGNSANVVKAAEFARSKGCKVLGFTGFSGGKLNTMSDVSLHIPFENYGVVEDAHQVLMHCLAQFHDIKMREGV
jgi:D-sedoheptulose 7-phosphate isomerase